MAVLRWARARTLRPVRDSYRTGRSLKWNRVYNLPGFVYFDHSIHIHKGVGCSSCHGRVDEMPLMYQVPSLKRVCPSLMTRVAAAPVRICCATMVSASASDRARAHGMPIRPSASRCRGRSFRSRPTTTT